MAQAEVEKDGTEAHDDRPRYDADFIDMREARGPLAEALAGLVLTTCAPYLGKPAAALDVLDVGCGYGATSLALARRCGSVTGLEPSRTLLQAAEAALREANVRNVRFSAGTVEGLDDVARYDLAVMDNVLEHVEDQPLALERVTRALRPGGVLFIVVPNKLWPIEAHYRLPFLSYLPLPAASWYLRASGRGQDYRDASHAPTYWRLRRLLRERPELVARFVVPSDLSATMVGAAWHYRLGAFLLRRMPALWAIAKAFVVVAVKRGAP